MSTEQKNPQSPPQSSTPQHTERNREQGPVQQRPSHMNQGTPGFRPSEKENKNPSSQHTQEDERSRKAS